MTTSRVYHLRFWVQDEERPWIDFELPENQPKISWLEVGRMVNGDALADEYSPVKLSVNEDEGVVWHSFEVAGTYGLLSNEVIDVIGEFMHQWFDLLDAQVNGRPFVFLRKKNTLTCFDRQNSTVVPFPHQPGSIMRIDRYRFFKEQIPDPAVFPIPEIRWHLFATESIQQMIGASDFKGLYFIDAEN